MGPASTPRQTRLHRGLLVFHRYIGLVAGIPILWLALTGCFLVVRDPIDRWANSQLFYVEPQGTPLSLTEIAARARAAFPNEQAMEVRVAPEADRAAVVFLRTRRIVFVNQYTGTITGHRFALERWDVLVGRLHTGIALGRPGRLVAGTFTAIALIGVLTGLYLWWPRKIFTVMWSAGWRRVNFDLHSAFGIFSSAVLVVTLATGVMMTWADTLERRINQWVDGRQPEAQTPLRSTAVRGATPITPDDAARIASQALPGSFTVGVSLPPAGPAVYNVLKRFPEDKTGGGRSRVVVDQFSGKVLRVVNARTAPAGTRIANATDPFHIGNVYGVPSMVLAFFGTAALAGQVVTGFLIWWRPRGRGAARATSRQVA